jgi:hypothetical protein
MNYGEVLGYITRMPKTKVKPFEQWEGSEVQDWEFEIELLNVGQNIEVSNAVANFPINVLAWIIRLELLARCIIKINGDPFGTQEDLNTYNKEHGLEGENCVSLFELRKIWIRKWDQVAVTKLEDEYNKLDQDHQKKLLGGVIKPENLQEEEKKKAEKAIQEVTSEIEKTTKAVKLNVEGTIERSEQ